MIPIPLSSDDQNDSNNLEGETMIELISEGSTVDKTQYYLEENINNLQTNQIIKKPIHIQHSSNFPNDKYEKYFEIYYDNFADKSQDQIFDEILNEINQHYPNFCITINSLTISDTIVDIDHIYTKCDIESGPNSILNAQYTIFQPESEDSSHFIYIHHNSKAEFKNCHFCNSSQLPIFINGYSTTIFDHCLFENNTFSIYLKNQSTAIFIDCKFKNDKKNSILSNFSYTEFVNCHFFNHEGKAIFAKDSSEIYISNSDFINCKLGAVTIVNSSKMILDGQILIENCSNTSLRAANNSEINGHDVTIKNINGNAINLDNSSGFFINFKIYKTFHPTIASLGFNSNPVFHNCYLYDNMSTFCVLCKNGARPLFDNCKFFDCETNCFSIYDFSHPHVQNCFFKNIELFYMNVYGGSYLTYNCLESGDDVDINSKINALKSAKFECKMFSESDADEKQSSEFKWMKLPDIFTKCNLKHLKKVKLDDIIKETENIEPVLKCSNCNCQMNEVDDANMINPCGHIICKNCMEIKRCPLCNSPVIGIKKLFLENVCAICLDKKPNSITLPCGHICLCYECAMMNLSKGFNCPLCNESVTYYKFNFDDTK